jgi:hypothetical protein
MADEQQKTTGPAEKSEGQVMAEMFEEMGNVLEPGDEEQELLKPAEEKVEAKPEEKKEEPKPEVKADEPETKEEPEKKEAKPSEEKPSEEVKEEEKPAEPFFKTTIKVDGKEQEVSFDQEQLARVVGEAEQYKKAGQLRMQQAAEATKRAKEEVASFQGELQRAQQANAEKDQVVRKFVEDARGMSTEELLMEARKNNVPVTEQDIENIRDGDLGPKWRIYNDTVASLSRISDSDKKRITELENYIRQQQTYIQDQEMADIGEQIRQDPMMASLNEVSTDPNLRLGELWAAGMVGALEKMKMPQEQMAEAVRKSTDAFSKGIKIAAEKGAMDVVLGDTERVKALLNALPERHPEVFDEFKKQMIGQYADSQKQMEEKVSPTLEGGGEGKPPTEEESGSEMTGYETDIEASKKGMPWFRETFGHLFGDRPRKSI